MSKLSIIAALLLIGGSARADGGTTSALAISAVSSASRVDDVDSWRRGRLVKHHGYYAAPTFGATMLNHELAPMVGLRSASVANRSFGVGGAFNALANPALQLNVTPFMRVSLGAGDRLAVAGHGSTLTNRELGGFVSRAALEFGKF